MHDGVIATERSIEIPLAVDFPDRHVNGEPVIELGCVLPYYIFKENNHIVYDLLDPHPANTLKDLREMSDDDYKSSQIVNRSFYAFLVAKLSPWCRTSHVDMLNRMTVIIVNHINIDLRDVILCAERMSHHETGRYSEK